MDKQFKASDKKRKKARKEGNFAKSSEMLPLVSSGIFVGLLYFGYRFSSVLVSQFRLMLAMSLSGSVTTGHLIQQGTIAVLFILCAVLGIVGAIGFLTEYLQVGLTFRWNLLAPKVSRFGPIAGLKRIVGIGENGEFGKLIVRVFRLVAALSLGMVLLYTCSQDVASEFYHFDIEAIYMSLLKAALSMSLLLVVLSGVELFHTRYAYEKSLMMSRKEMKDEYKEDNGDPEVMAKRKGIMQSWMMSSMITGIRKSKMLIKSQ